MAIELFWASGSPYAWRVMLTLEHKRVPYEGQMLSFSSNDTKSDWYRAISPRGRVPALRDGSFVLTESVAIMTYLDRKFPEQPLFGRTAEEAGLVARVISEYTSYVDHALEGFIIPLYFGGATEHADKLRKFASKLHQELALLESQLEAQPFIVGQALTAADFVWFPHIKSIERAAGKDAATPFEFGFLPLEQRFPAIHAWTRRIESLPGYERTYPPHWR
jgi:glutathione S-transferase